MEDNHEQHASEYASEHAAGRRTAAVRSQDAMAHLSRTAKSRVARATRCMAGAAPRMESRIMWARTARAFRRLSAP